MAKTNPVAAGGRIARCFAALHARGEKALIPFVTAGDPDLETTEAIVLALADAGADLIEIGVPFSDPIAEGPTIQRSSERALRRKTSLRAVLALVQRVRSQVDVPLLLMGYANPFFAMGEEGFAKAAEEVGVDGVIVPDLPPEEGESFYAALERHGIDGVLLAAPTTRPARLKLLVERTHGFLYYVSLTGVTGARAQMAAGVREAVLAAKALGPTPVCVGFGISTAAQAREVAGYADGVVVGSALVDRIARAASPDAAVDAAARFVAELKEGVNAAR
jgi:tryptophan synthase alpha chain